MLNVNLKFGWLRQFAATAAIVLTGMQAHAVSLSPNANVLNSFDLAPDATAEFLFEPTESLFVTIISVAGSGFPGGDDLEMVRFGVNGTDTGFTAFSDNGPTSSAEGALPSFFVSNPFTVNFAAPGTTLPVGITYTLVTENTPTLTPVPLPASGLMLGSVLLVALGGLAFRRRLQS